MRDLRQYLSLPEEVTIAQIVNELVRIRNKAIRDKCTFQSALYMIKNVERSNGMENLLKNLDPSLKKVISYRNTLNESAGMWLRTFCRYEQFRLSNNEFCVGLCLRYCIKIPLIQELDFCPICKFKLAGSPCGIDGYGHHFLSGCNTDVKHKDGCGQLAQPHAIHDQLRRVLYQIAKHAMATKVVQEPRFLLHRPIAKNQVRPDLQVNFPVKMVSKTHALDITLCCPFSGSRSGQLFVNHKVAANGDPIILDKKLEDDIANYRKVTKDSKYKQLCNDRSITFVPFVMYSTGRIHKDAMAFLKKLARHAHDARNIPEATLLKYYIKVLNFTLIKEAANTIYIKSLESVSADRFSNVRSKTAIRIGNLQAFEIANPPLAINPVFRNT